MNEVVKADLRVTAGLSQMISFQDLVTNWNCYYDLQLNVNLISNLENFEQYGFEFGLVKSHLRQSL